MQEGNSLFNRFKIFIKNIKGIVFTAALLCLIVVLFGTAVSGAAEKADASAAATLEKAIKKAAVQCYAIEGFYPVDLEYLIENYGVIVDETRFIVYYSASSSNYIPVIQIQKFE